MPSANTHWCAVDARDVATARMVLSAAQQTFGNPATLVQKLLGLSSDDYQEVVQSLSASGASYVDIVAAYLHNLRVLYDDCGGQFPPEIFSLSTQSATEQMVKDAVHHPAAPSPKSSHPTGMFQPPLSPTTPKTPHMPPSPSAPLAPKSVSYSARRSIDLLTSPRSTLTPPTHTYPYSTSPSSPSSVVVSPRPFTPPSSSWATPRDPSPTAASAAAWQAQLQYQQLLAQTSMALPPVSPIQFASAEALLNGQAPPVSLPPSLLLPPHSVPAPQIPTQQQQYLSALAASLQAPTTAPPSPLSIPTYMLFQQQQQQAPAQQPPMPCAYSAACMPVQQVPQEASGAYLPPGCGLNYDSIKRIWEAPSAMSHLTHHLHRLV